jgi:transketolase
MIELRYVPKDEIARIRGLGLDRFLEAKLVATACRLNALYMIARAGSGHVGSSFSSLDVVSWLYLRELRRGGASPDLYFSSKGHDAPGLYAVLQAVGELPFETIHGLRRLGGLPGHPDVATPGMVTNTGPLGMGISKAKGMVAADRLADRARRIFVMTGDGELQEGQIWESLASAVRRQMGEITVVVDHNKVQSDSHVADVSDLGDLEAKLRAFGWETARCDGHDLAALSSVLDRFREIADRPKVVIADTVKGAGVSFMQHTAMAPGEKLYRFHSGAPDDASYDKAVSELVGLADALLAGTKAGPLRVARAERPPRPDAAGAQRLVPAYGQALVAAAARRPEIVALDADLVLDTGLIPFSERFPERFFECGIAEQDMVSQAGGMALQGLLPVVHSFACFLSTRPNEQIYNNATEGRRIVYVGSLAGLLPSGPGHSHQCVRDIASLGGIPGLVLLEPSCEGEVAPALAWCLDAETSSYLRLVSIPCHVPYALPAGHRLALGRGTLLREGKDAVVFGYGPVLLPQAFRAADLLAEKHGRSIAVVSLPWLNRIDADWLADTIAGRPVFTLDDHYLEGGQGERIAAAIAEQRLGVPVRRFGVDRVPVCGQNDEALRAHGLDGESLAGEIAATLTRASP